MEIPDNKTVDIQLYILDPLSVIIKLAILSNKPIGTKICISNNIICLQDPGPFQAFCRYIFSTTKSDIQYIYNPIQLACQQYLSKDSVSKNPKLKELFKCAQNGLVKLSETYKSCSIIRLCINYYATLIDNHLQEIYNDGLFKSDSMTPLYTNELAKIFTKLWTQERIKIILNLTTFLIGDEHAATNVKSVETIMVDIDTQVQKLI
uniref:Uncharacterized protein n=1 Tax=viral metagenome TaxID=1070528 RepID=A0A6C0I9D4_9ZZZZ